MIDNVREAMRSLLSHRYDFPSGSELARVLEFNTADELIAWNDHPDTTKDDVLRLIRGAAG